MSRSRLVWAVAATCVLVGSFTTGIVMALPLDLSPFGAPRLGVFVQERPSHVVGPQLRRAPWAFVFEWAQGGQTNQRQGRVYSSKEKGITLPTVVSESKPTYTRAALDAKIAGDVTMTVVVKADGKVGAVKVVKSLDTTYGLDQAAVDSARLWTFKPGTLNGRAVDVEVALQMRFTYR